MAASTRPIWSKRANQAPSPRALAYCAGRDVAARPAADAELIPYDLWTNRAHCRMLARQGIVDAATHRKIVRALGRIEREWAAGAFTLDPTLEDVHMNIERAVAQLEGESAAGVMHTARSRNDQSATDVRLWLRDRLLERLAGLGGLIDALARLAARHAKTIAPGWTHGQPAMPTTLGHWAASHAWALARDAKALRALWPLINECPLGSAASFGTSWPIDRKLTARLLGFDRPQPNSLDSISTRWESEARLAGVLAVMMTHLSSLGQDLIFLSSPPRSLIRLSDAHVTGSSIMPNKRNPDFAEVTRSRARSVAAMTGSLASVGLGALSGYNRDTQWTKYWIMDLLWEVGEAPEVFAEAVAGITVDKKALCAAATQGFSLAADLADRLASTRAIPFRRAYHAVAEAVARDEFAGRFTLETFNDILKREKISPLFSAQELAAAQDPAQVLAARRSLGGPAPADTAAQSKALRQEAAAALRFARTQTRRLAAVRTRKS